MLIWIRILLLLLGDYLIYNFTFNIDNSANKNISYLGDLYINSKLIEYSF